MIYALVIKENIIIRITMQNRQQHQQEVLDFLQKNISNQPWKFELPKGWGNETYFAHNKSQDCFVKLGAQAPRYQTVASIGLTAAVLSAGVLEDGTSIIVQPYIVGRRPSRTDYRSHLAQFAMAIDQLHNNLEVKQILPQVSSNLYSIMGAEALNRLRKKWEIYKLQVPKVTRFIDESLDHLEHQVREFMGKGLVASHNDICNYNWLITSDGKLYLLDLEMMSLDDPALDIGATLWWYYPPELRGEFLEMTGYSKDAEFERRMQVRMTMHCLNIRLPREQSYDQFDPTSFDECLTDFRAILAGEENPEGYDD
jgi:thiamine kinase-like enzyme